MEYKNEKKTQSQQTHSQPTGDTVQGFKQE